MKSHALLDSWRWYFVSLDSQGEKLRFVLDDSEYEDFMQRNERNDRFIKIGEKFYFWSDIKSFGPIEFEDGVLSQIRQLDAHVQERVKQAIRSGQDVSTMDKLRSLVLYFLQ